MRKRTSVVVRLFVMLAMALGLSTLLASPAAAQSTQTGQCQITTAGGTDQSPCTIVIDGAGQCQLIGEDDQVIFQNAEGCGEQSCPRQITSSEGSAQFQCDAAEATNTPVPATNTPVPATDVPATETPVTPGTTQTPVTPGATQTPVTPSATQAPEVPEEEGPVDELPDTGHGSISGQSNSANIILLGAMGTMLTLCAVAMRLRSNR